MHTRGQVGSLSAVSGFASAPSHPGAAPMGWDRFAALVRDQPMPAYAIGGLTRADLAEARARGGHGVALLRAAFG